MTEREALVKLIEAVDFFDAKSRRIYLEHLDEISDKEVHDMGVFLATYIQSETKDLNAAKEKLQSML